jgi:hypothetical protein
MPVNLGPFDGDIVHEKFRVLTADCLVLLGLPVRLECICSADVLLEAPFMELLLVLSSTAVL